VVNGKNFGSAVDFDRVPVLVPSSSPILDTASPT
jgi:hypothetical protein